MCVFSSGHLHSRLSGAQWCVDSAEEGPICEVRDLLLQCVLSKIWISSLRFSPAYCFFFLNLSVFLSISASDLSRAEPTLTHMCIWMLLKVKMVGDKMLNVSVNYQNPRYIQHTHIKGVI